MVVPEKVIDPVHPSFYLYLYFLKTVFHEIRHSQLVFQEAEVIEMDGFVIELDVDPDEPLMVSREEPYKPPDYRYFQSLTFENHFDFIFCLYSGGARCIICM